MLVCTFTNSQCRGLWQDLKTVNGYLNRLRNMQGSLTEWKIEQTNDIYSTDTKVLASSDNVGIVDNNIGQNR